MIKSLVIYDSNFGNTQKVAEAIARELKAQAVHVSKVLFSELAGLDLIVVGSPINAWRPSEKMGRYSSMAMLQKR